MHIQEYCDYFWREACCMVSLLVELKNDAFVPFLMQKALKMEGNCDCCSWL